jgi:hypothetical protein
MKYECCKLAQKISFMHAIDQLQDFFITYLEKPLLKSLKIVWSIAYILGIGGNVQF